LKNDSFYWTKKKFKWFWKKLSFFTYRTIFLTHFLKKRKIFNEQTIHWTNEFTERSFIVRKQKKWKIKNNFKHKQNYFFFINRKKTNEMGRSHELTKRKSRTCPSLIIRREFRALSLIGLKKWFFKKKC